MFPSILNQLSYTTGLKQGRRVPGRRWTSWMDNLDRWFGRSTISLFRAAISRGEINMMIANLQRWRSIRRRKAGSKKLEEILKPSYKMISTIVSFKISQFKDRMLVFLALWCLFSLFRRWFNCIFYYFIYEQPLNAACPENRRKTGITKKVTTGYMWKLLSVKVKTIKYNASKKGNGWNVLCRFLKYLNRLLVTLLWAFFCRKRGENYVSATW
jgi:hypothetical protein